MDPVGWKGEGQVIVGTLDGHKTRYHSELRRVWNRAPKSNNGLDLGEGEVECDRVIYEALSTHNGFVEIPPYSITISLNN